MQTMEVVTQDQHDAAEEVLADQNTRCIIIGASDTLDGINQHAIRLAPSSGVEANELHANAEKMRPDYIIRFR